MKHLKSHCSRPEGEGKSPVVYADFSCRIGTDWNIIYIYTHTCLHQGKHGNTAVIAFSSKRMHHLIFLNTHFMSWRKQSDRDTKEQICAILGGYGSTFFLAPFCANGTPGQLPAWDWVSWCYWSLWRVASWRTWSAQGLQREPSQILDQSQHENTCGSTPMVKGWHLSGKHFFGATIWHAGEQGPWATLPVKHFPHDFGHCLHAQSFTMQLLLPGSDWGNPLRPSHELKPSELWWIPVSWRDPSKL